MDGKTHLTWSVEKPCGQCPTCESETILVVAFGEMKIAEGDEGTPQNETYEEMGGTLSVEEEISGHYCMTCCKLTSLSLNT